MNLSKKSTQDNTPGRLLVMAWPEAVAKTDGNWYDIIFKIMNNQSGFHKVGHAAIAVMNMISGEINYFDFGRYLTKERAGRARSIETDPDVVIKIKGKIKNDKVENMEEILQFLAFHEPLHGSGALWATFPEEIVSVEETIKYVRQYQERGDIRYGPFIYKGSNCSRFVCDVAKSIFKNEKRIRHLNYPISCTPTPLGNVFSSSLGQSPIWKVNSDYIETISYNWHFAAFDMGCSVFTFNPPPPNASPEGTLVAPKRVSNVPKAAQWLGALGAGAWFHIEKNNNNNNLGENEYLIHRFAPNGDVEFSRKFYCEQTDFDISKDYYFQYNTNARWCYIEQNGHVFKFLSEEEICLKKGLSPKNAIQLSKKSQEDLSKVLC
ncbi:MAG: DUF6695 family protein [Saprospiraceae bacterium]